MQVKYLLNLNSNHNVNERKISYKSLTTVFKHNLYPYQYKDEKVLKDLCWNLIKYLESLQENNEQVIGFDQPVYIIYSGLAVVMLAFVNELIKEGYRPIVLFEDKDNGGYYEMEVNY
jgi:hypothetical protein